jgi:hypothetical protein
MSDSPYQDDRGLPAHEDRTTLGILLDLSPATEKLADFARTILRDPRLLVHSGIAPHLETIKWLWKAICATDLEIFFYGTGCRAGNGVVDLLSLMAAGKDPSIGERAIASHESSSLGTLIGGAAIKLLLDRLGLPELGSIAGIVTATSAKSYVTLVAEALVEKAQNIGDSSITVAQLAKSLEKSKRQIDPYAYRVFFNAPSRMKTAAYTILDRFKRLATSEFRRKVLIVVSTGIFQDDDPRPAFQSLREAGVIVLTCFISRDELSNPKPLYDAKDSSWSEGEQLLWDIASRLSDLPGALPAALGSQSLRVGLFTRMVCKVPP